MYFINANDGQIITKLNRVTSVTGTGKVYPKHPGNSSLTTKNLYGLLGNGRLDGTYVKVYNNSGSEAYSASHSFLYSTSSSHFDEVSVYYHVDNFRRNFIEALDAGNNLFTKIDTYTNSNSTCSGGANNACFSGGDLHFGDGYNFAREDKVVHHEYGHAVINDIESGILSWNNEEGAISEGTPDFFAGTFTNRAVIGEYVLPAYQRSMSSPYISSYAQYQSESPGAHTGGEFFSSILWDIRNNSGISAAETDFLVFDALYRVSGNPDFMEFRDAMMSADGVNNGAAHRYIIQDVFNDKGVGSPSAIPVTISGPVYMDEGTSETWTSNIASNSNGVPPYTYEWTRVIPGQTGGYAGNGISYTGTQFDDFTLELEVTDSNGKQGFEDLAVVVDEGGGGCIICKQVVLPTEFTLSNNYPNPFNPSTQIKFELPETAEVSIKVYNIMGQEVATIVNDQMQAGFHNATFTADNLASGIYMARLSAIGSSGKQFIREIKMQLIK